jgi:hypothetical protein
MNSQFAKLKGSPKTGRGLRQEGVEYKETRNTAQVALGSGREYNRRDKPSDRAGLRKTESRSNRGSEKEEMTQTRE